MGGTGALFGLAALGACAMTTAVGQEEKPVQRRCLPRGPVALP